MTPKEMEAKIEVMDAQLSDLLAWREGVGRAAAVRVVQRAGKELLPTHAFHESQPEQWRAALDILERRVSDHAFATWLVPVRCIRCDAAEVHLEVHDTFAKHWVEDHYVELIRACLSKVMQAPADIRVSVAAKVCGVGVAQHREG